MTERRRGAGTSEGRRGDALWGQACSGEAGSRAGHGRVEHGASTAMRVGRVKWHATRVGIETTVACIPPSLIEDPISESQQLGYKIEPHMEESVEAGEPDYVEGARGGASQREA